MSVMPDSNQDSPLNVFFGLERLQIDPLLRLLFRTLNQHGISWAIWKSLEYLPRQLVGDYGDIDLLIDREAKPKFVRLAGNVGFIEDKNSPAGNRKDIFVLRSINPSNGCPFMLHVHERLRVGSKAHKEIWMPFEDRVLKNVITADDLRVAAASDFFALRVLGFLLKDRKREDVFLRRLLIQSFATPTELNEGLAGGLSEITSEEFVKTLRRELGAPGFPSSALRADATDFVRKIRIPLHERLRFIWFSRMPRRNKVGPLFLVLYGHDGAGKTTAAEKVLNILGHLGPTRSLYLGRSHWAFFNTALSRLQGRRGFASLLWHLSSGVELFVRHWKAWFFYFIGYNVVADRGVADFAVKYGNSKRGILRGLGALGLNQELVSPSQKFLLVCDPRTSVERDPSLSLEEHSLRKHQYERVLGSHFEVIDTTKVGPEAVCQKLVESALIKAGSRNGN